MAKSLFEQMGGTYIRQGDYEIPNLTLPSEKKFEIGVWGRRYKRYLKQHHKVLYYNYFTSGKLYEHLAEVDIRAEKMFQQLVKSLTEKENVTEKLKAEKSNAVGTKDEQHTKSCN